MKEDTVSYAIRTLRMSLSNSVKSFNSAIEKEDKKLITIYADRLCDIELAIRVLEKKDELKAEENRLKGYLINMGHIKFIKDDSGRIHAVDLSTPPIDDTVYDYSLIKKYFDEQKR